MVGTKEKNKTREICVPVKGLIQIGSPIKSPTNQAKGKYISNPVPSDKTKLLQEQNVINLFLTMTKSHTYK